MKRRLSNFIPYEDDKMPLEWFLTRTLEINLFAIRITMRNQTFFSISHFCPRKKKKSFLVFIALLLLKLLFMCRDSDR